MHADYAWTMGVMQGRLSPPVDGRIQAFPWHEWAEEFPRAREAGVSLIEWIVDADRFDENPLLTRAGRSRIAELTEQTGTTVRTVCADCFMPWPLTTRGAGEREARLGALRRILEASAEVGVDTVTLPFVDASAIRAPDEMAAVEQALREAAPAAEALGIVLALETALPPAALKALIDRVNHPSVRINYDMGNCASLGFDPAEELATYGDRVAVVHVKDRVLGGGTVTPGTGDVKFEAVFNGLRRAGYRGPLILQVARGDGEMPTVTRALEFFRPWISN